MLFFFSRSVHCDCSFPMSLRACLHASLLVYLPACLHACLRVCLFVRLPACLHACLLASLPAYLPPCQPASECTSLVRPSVRPSDRPFVRPSVRRAPGQLYSNDTFELQLSSNSSNTVHIERNIQVGGPALALKNRKKAFQKSIEKKEGKKEARQPVRGEGRRSRCSPGNPKIPLRKALAKSRKQV